MWVVGIDAGNCGAARHAERLSAAEIEQASRYREGDARLSFIARRAALRAILGLYLGVAPRDIGFSVNEFGKPEVRTPGPHARISFNASHAGAVALVALARAGRVGVDIERLRRSAEHHAVAARFFSAREAAALSALPAREQDAAFFNAWTRKESLIKAVGGGLSIALDSFDVSLRPGEAPQILRCDIPGESAERWRMRHLEPATGYVGALAWDSPAAVCRCWRWTG